MSDTDVRTFRLNPNSVVFRTDGVWGVDDVRRFVGAVEGIYKPFLAVHLVRESSSNIEARLPELFEQRAAYLRELEQRFGGGLPSDFGRISQPSPEVLYSLARQQSDYLAFIHDNITTVAPGDRLTVGKVRMGSQGFFSFQGLGEPIQQLREFIKDLCYRNRQERERGDMDMEHQRQANRLELARQHLQLQRDFADLLAEPENRLALAALDNGDKLEQLELEGKLTNVPDNLEPESVDSDEI